MTAKEPKSAPSRAAVLSVVPRAPELPESPESNDAELVARLKRGDAAAFDEVYQRYSARIYAFLARMAQRREVAEDLAQETWIRLATHAPRLRDDTRLGAWLFTVARNLHRSHCRWRVLDGARMHELGLGRYRAGEDVSPYDMAAAGETGMRLEAALAALAPRYREVILLVAVERMEPAEAAAVLGLRPDALRQRLARARGMIAAALGELAPDGARKRGE